MIIIEGADLVGKTTLCERLQQILTGEGAIYSPLPLARRSLGILPKTWHYPGSYLQMLRDEFTLFDRFHLSEVAYGSLLRYEPKIRPRDYRLIDAALQVMGGIVVVLTADREVITRLYHEQLSGVAGAQSQLFELDQILAVNDLMIAMARLSRGDPYDKELSAEVHRTPALITRLWSNSGSKPDELGELDTPPTHECNFASLFAPKIDAWYHWDDYSDDPGPSKHPTFAEKVLQLAHHARSKSMPYRHDIASITRAT